MGYWMLTGRDAVTNGENYALARPSGWTALLGTTAGVVFCHGKGQSAAAGWDNTNLWAQSALIAHVAQQGHAILACDLGGPDTWGYDPSNARIDDAIAYLHSIGAKAGKVVLFGVSMGGLTALTYAAAHPENVAALVMLAPVSDMTWTVANNAELAAAINAVYPGGWDEGTYGAVHNPLTIATAGGYDGLPMQIWQGDSDTTVPPARTQALVAQCDSAELHVIPGEHAPETWAEVPAVDVHAFIAAHT